jgi:hypothetical protein
MQVWIGGKKNEFPDYGHYSPDVINKVWKEGDNGKKPDWVSWDLYEVATNVQALEDVIRRVAHLARKPFNTNVVSLQRSS